MRALFLTVLLAGILYTLSGCGRMEAADPQPVVELTPAEDPLPPSPTALPAVSITPTPAPTATPAPVPPREMDPRVRDELAPALVDAYSAKADPARIEQILDQIAEADPSSAAAWEKILAYWDMVNSDGFVNMCDGREAAQADGAAYPAFETGGSLPEGLPKDESLCFVVLGFALESDGSPRKELIDRLITVSALAGEYPEARILLTGGPTAYGNAAATEAGAMAEWLQAHGIQKERLLLEDRSLITYDNAVFSYDLLRETHPEIQDLVIVSSDYHIPLGCILFEAQCLLRNSGDYDLHVAANAACTTGGYYHFGLQDQAKQVKGLFRDRDNVR